MTKPEHFRRGSRLFSLIRLTCSIGCVLIGLAVALNARLRTPSLVERVSQSNLVFIGEIQQVQKGSARVARGEVLKGVLTSALLSLEWETSPSLEMMRAPLLVGQTVLISANNEDDRVVLNWGAMGIQPIQDPATYRAAVKFISSYHSAPDNDARAKILMEMLQAQSQVAQTAALEILYLESRELPSGNLVPALVAMTRSDNNKVAAPATQALSRVASKAEIPLLIDLFESPNKHVAATAISSVKEMTGGKIPLDATAPIETRKAAAQRWRDWWRANSEKVKLKK